MASTPTATTDAEHEVEVAKQAEIKAEVAANEATSKAHSDAADAEVVAAQQSVSLRSVNVKEYPLTVTVPNAEPLVFENESAIVDVDPEVAEQIAYSPVVEVVE